jgi:hypothetical protein
MSALSKFHDAPEALNSQATNSSPVAVALMFTVMVLAPLLALLKTS